MTEFTPEHQRRRSRKERPDPKLLEAIMAIIPAGSPVIDLGAGNGELVAKLQEHGYDAIGVDATPGIEDTTHGLVFEMDLLNMDWSRTEIELRIFLPNCWMTCIEVGEHIDRADEWRLFGCFAQIWDGGLILSWAVPGQRGYGHINCRTPEYLRDALARLPSTVPAFDEELTLKARQIAGGGWAKKLLVFKD